jgi:hypothetical protein
MNIQLRLPFTLFKKILIGKGILELMNEHDNQDGCPVGQDGCRVGHIEYPGIAS